ncbi:hypothetical protein AVEN_263650-1 [Araneus ventricosus]|uniref:DDE-1 domain-containing protein n=1 Tax=Araneus ventricosus TaxID=182803 RepID=A0A4Y2ATU9_ARAVE|nr:hypothetical protein AVEN_263650-1 [Araneus ventricosus]
MERKFLKFSKHFVHHARCSPARPFLLLLDNLDSHLSFEVLDYFKDNGVTVLSFPPHCSHKLQPLDRSVYGQLKKFINRACDSWMSNKKRPLTIYDIPSIWAIALPLATTPLNIKSGFRVTGIYRLNTEIFQDVDFRPFFVTDRPVPTESNPLPQTPTHTFGSSTSVTIGPISPIPPGIASNFDEPVAGTSGICITKSFPTPEDVRPFQKAGPRKSNNRSRKKKPTSILQIRL